MIPHLSLCKTGRKRMKRAIYLSTRMLSWTHVKQSWSTAGNAISELLLTWNMGGTGSSRTVDVGLIIWNKTLRSRGQQKNVFRGHFHLHSIEVLQCSHESANVIALRLSYCI